MPPRVTPIIANHLFMLSWFSRFNNNWRPLTDNSYNDFGGHGEHGSAWQLDAHSQEWCVPVDPVDPVDPLVVDVQQLSSSSQHSRASVLQTRHWTRWNWPPNNKETKMTIATIYPVLKSQQSSCSHLRSQQIKLAIKHFNSLSHGTGAQSRHLTYLMMALTNSHASWWRHKSALWLSLRLHKTSNKSVAKGPLQQGLHGPHPHLCESLDSLSQSHCGLCADLHDWSALTNFCSLLATLINWFKLLLPQVNFLIAAWISHGSSSAYLIILLNRFNARLKDW